MRDISLKVPLASLALGRDPEGHHMDDAMVQSLSQLSADAGEILAASPRSVSLITGPSGVSIGDELCNDEGIVYAEINLADCVEPKQFHDVSGGYNRFDIFQLTVNRGAQRPVRFADLTNPEDPTARADGILSKGSDPSDSSDHPGER